MDDQKKKIPVREGLWAESTSTYEKPQLLGSRCQSCEELFFPRKEIPLCACCQSGELEEVKLGRKGKIYSFSVVTQRPPVYYKGEVPDSLHVGMDVEMVIEKLHEDEDGNEVMAYKFRPSIS
jgi:uncharacterized OB-fold protein